MVDIVVRLEGTRGGRVRLHSFYPPCFEEDERSCNAWIRTAVIILHGDFNGCDHVPGDHFEISR